MNMFDRADENFLNTAFDPLQRKKAVDEMAFVRPIIFGCWCLVFSLVASLPVVALLVRVSGYELSPLSDQLIPWIVILLLTIAYLRFESRLRLLKIIDRLQREQSVAIKSLANSAATHVVDSTRESA